jgi:hypothetical protein
MTCSITVKRLLMATALVVLMPSLANAGTTGVFNGYARLVDGEPVEGAVVRVLSPTHSAVTYTDAHGFFTFIDLAPDVYSVSVEKDPKFASFTSVSVGVRINSDQTTFIIFPLKYARCPTSPLVSISGDQSSEDYVSLDLRLLSRSPMPLGKAMIPLPIHDVRPFFGCL